MEPTESPAPEAAVLRLAGAAGLDAAHRGLRVARYRSLLWHWVRRWFAPPHRSMFERLPSVPEKHVAVTFIGHASVLVRYPGAAICVDPMLGGWVGGARRAVEAGLAPADLDDVALILITHLHSDHFHAATLAQLPKSAMLVGPRGVAAAAAQFEFARVLELTPGTDLAFGDITIYAEPVRHGDDQVGGLSYVMRSVAGAPSVYVCGDSGYFSGFADIGARHAPDLACLPIGGFLPLSFRDRHMSPIDALVAFSDLRARLLLPIHHGAFALSYEKLDEPLRLLRETATAYGLREHLLVMQPGQSQRIGAAAPTSEHVDEPHVDVHITGPFDTAFEGDTEEHSQHALVPQATST